MLSWDTSSPRPQPATTSGIASHQPLSTRGTIGMIASIPMLSSANPIRMRPAGRRFAARWPARVATANMLSESGASARPACSAL